MTVNVIPNTFWKKDVIAEGINVTSAFADLANSTDDTFKLAGGKTAANAFVLSGSVPPNPTYGAGALRRGTLRLYSSAIETEYNREPLMVVGYAIDKNIQLREGGYSFALSGGSGTNIVGDKLALYNSIPYTTVPTLTEEFEGDVEGLGIINRMGNNSNVTLGDPYLTETGIKAVLKSQGRTTNERRMKYIRQVLKPTTYKMRKGGPQIQPVLIVESNTRTVRPEHGADAEPLGDRQANANEQGSSTSDAYSGRVTVRRYPIEFIDNNIRRFTFEDAGNFQKLGVGALDAVARDFCYGNHDIDPKHIKWGSKTSATADLDGNPAASKGNTILSDIYATRDFSNPYDASDTNPIIMTNIELSTEKSLNGGQSLRMYHNWGYSVNNTTIQNQIEESGNLNPQCARASLYNIPFPPMPFDVGMSTVSANDDTKNFGDARAVMPEIQVALNITKMEPNILLNLNAGENYATDPAYLYYTKHSSGSSFFSKVEASLLRCVCVTFSNYKPKATHTTLDKFLDYGLTNYYDGKDSDNIVGGVIFTRWNIDGAGNSGESSGSQSQGNNMYAYALPVTRIPQQQITNPVSYTLLSGGMARVNAGDDELAACNSLVWGSPAADSPASDDEMRYAELPMNSWVTMRCFTDVFQYNNTGSATKRPYAASSSTNPTVASGTRGVPMRIIFETDAESEQIVTEGASAPLLVSGTVFESTTRNLPFLDIFFPAGAGSVAGDNNWSIFDNPEYFPKHMTIWAQNYCWIDGGDNTTPWKFGEQTLYPEGASRELELFIDSIKLLNYGPTVKSVNQDSVMNFAPTSHFSPVSTGFNSSDAIYRHSWVNSSPIDLTGNVTFTGADGGSITGFDAGVFTGGGNVNGTYGNLETGSDYTVSPDTASVDAILEVVISSGPAAATVTIDGEDGLGYSVGDTFRILGGSCGGSDGVDDILVDVATINSYPTGTIVDDGLLDATMLDMHGTVTVTSANAGIAGTNAISHFTGLYGFVMSGTAIGSATESVVFTAPGTLDPYANRANFFEYNTGQNMVFGFDSVDDIPIADSAGQTGYVLANDFTTYDWSGVSGDALLPRKAVGQPDAADDVRGDGLAASGAIFSRNHTDVNFWPNVGVSGYKIVAGGDMFIGGPGLYDLGAGTSPFNNVSGCAFLVDDDGTDLVGDSINLGTGTNPFLSSDGFRQKGFTYFNVSGTTTDVPFPPPLFDDGGEVAWGKRESVLCSTKITTIPAMVNMNTSSDDNLSDNQIMVQDPSIFNFENPNETYVIYLMGGEPNTTAGAGPANFLKFRKGNLTLADEPEGNIITFTSNLRNSSAGEVFIKEQNIDRLWVGPEKLWLTMMFDTPPTLSNRTYSSFCTINQVPSSGTLSAASGTTFNESQYSYNLGAIAAGGESGIYTNLWDLVPVEENSTLITDVDYGFGALDVENGTGGYILYGGVQPSSYNFFNFNDIGNNYSPGDNIPLVLYLSPDTSSVAPHSATFYSDDFTTVPEKVPTMYWEFVDDPPLAVQLQVGPLHNLSDGDVDLYELTTEDINALNFTWSEGNADDVWYRMLMVSEAPIVDKYHGATLWLPLNESVTNYEVSPTYKVYNPTTQASTTLDNSVTGVGDDVRGVLEGQAGFAPQLSTTVDGKITVPYATNAGLKDKTEFTLVVHWTPSAADQGNVRYVVTQSDDYADTEDNFHLYKNASDKIVVELGDDIALTGSKTITCDGSQPASIILTLNTGSAHPNKAHLYVDGAWQDSSTGTTNAQGNNDFVLGGRYVASTYTGSTGLVEEVLIYDKAHHVPNVNTDFVLATDDYPDYTGLTSAGVNNITYNARLLVADYHNFRGYNKRELGWSNQTSWRTTTL